jgi:hypothetical protein
MTSWVPRLLLLSLLGYVLSQPSSVLFTDCSTSDYDPQLRINVSAVYAQLQDDHILKFTILGRTGQPIIDSSNATGAAFRGMCRFCPCGNVRKPLTFLVPVSATAFVTTSVLTYTTAENATAFCSTLRPPSPLPALPSQDATYCPIPPGDLAFSVTTPYKHHYQLTTVTTRIHVVDSSTPSRDLLCIDASVTPVSPNSSGPTYGIAQILFWASVMLCACYWAVLGSSRIAAAWSRGKGRTAPRGFARLQWFGTVLASAISGEHLSSSPALLRFGASFRNGHSNVSSYDLHWYSYAVGS